MTGLARSLWPEGFQQQWRFVQGPENHDIVLQRAEARIARLGDPDHPRSWFRARPGAKSRLRVEPDRAGIPMLFMGQEFLEDKQWSDDFVATKSAALLGRPGPGRQTDARPSALHQKLLAVRRRCPGLRGEGFRVVHVHGQNRVLAFHRWVEGEGLDVLVVLHLANATRVGYRIGFPGGGGWREIFNSDAYENWLNAGTAGNSGRSHRAASPLHGFDYSANLVLPANGMLIFSR